MSGPASPTPRRRYNVCRVTPNVSYQPVGLVLDVKGLQAPSEAALVLKHFLDHPDLAKAVEKELTKQAKQHLEVKHPKPVKKPSNESPAGNGKAKDPKQSEFRNDPIIRAMIGGARDVGLDYLEHCTEVGAFYNQNKGQIVVVGTLMAIPGVLAMWHSQSDDLSGLVEAAKVSDKLKLGYLGTLSLEAGIKEFRPSKKTLSGEFKLGLKSQWTPVLSTEFKLDGLVKTERAQITGNAKGTSTISFRATDALTLSGGAMFQFEQTATDRRLDLEQLQMSLNYDISGVRVGLGYQRQFENRRVFEHNSVLLKVGGDW